MAKNTHYGLVAKCKTGPRKDLIIITFPTVRNLVID